MKVTKNTAFKFKWNVNSLKLPRKTNQSWTSRRQVEGLLRNSDGTCSLQNRSAPPDPAGMAISSTVGFLGNMTRHGTI